MNTLLMIEPYRKGSTWVFDDAEVGLKAEPFVSGIPEIIDQVLKEQGQHSVDKFTLIFSQNQFPGSRLLTKLEEDFGGNWYQDDLTGMRGWLCPALFRYFPEAPEKLYCRIQ